MRSTIFPFPQVGQGFVLSISAIGTGLYGLKVKRRRVINESVRLINFSGNATGDTSQNPGLSVTKRLHFLCWHCHLHHQHMVLVILSSLALAYALFDHLPVRSAASLCHVDCKFHQFMFGWLVVVWKQEHGEIINRRLFEVILIWLSLLTMKTVSRQNTQFQYTTMNHPHMMPV